jgi:hypothetical protein
MDLIRRRIEDGGDPQPLLATLRRQVQQSISEHVRFVQPDEVEVTIEQEACRITTRRLPRSRH